MLNIPFFSHPAEKPTLADSLSSHALPIHQSLALCRGKDIILIGEETCGTREFYETRCNLTKKLIEDGQISGLCLEGDWPDICAVHRFVTLMSDSDVTTNGFQHFPTWSWKNHSVRKFLLWLREHNRRLTPEKRCGVFGIDLFSLNLSMQAIIEHMKKCEPSHVNSVTNMFECFDRCGSDPVQHGLTAGLTNDICLAASVPAFTRDTDSLKAPPSPTSSSVSSRDEAFMKEMNKKQIHEAEEYYRSMFHSNLSSWEVRDNNMFNMLERIREHLMQTRNNNRVVVWSHNSHIGDSRHAYIYHPSMNTTPLQHTHELNLGQLIRQKYPSNSLLIGQLCYTGEVSAAPSYGAHSQSIALNPPLKNSIEDVCHTIASKVGRHQFMLDCHESHTRNALQQAGQLLERGVGVVYHTNAERQNHYFHANVEQQFDALFYFDQTNPVVPLDMIEPPLSERMETFAITA